VVVAIIAIGSISPLVVLILVLLVVYSGQQVAFLVLVLSSMVLVHPLV